MEPLPAYGQGRRGAASELFGCVLQVRARTRPCERSRRHRAYEIVQLVHAGTKMLRERDDAIAINLARVDLPAVALRNYGLQRRAERRVDGFEPGRQRVVDDEPVDRMIDDRAHADVER